MADKQVRVGISVIIWRDGKVLMGRRKGSHGAGTYSFPGGHMEYGETVEQAAVREVEEETGVKIKNLAPARGMPYTTTVFHEINAEYVTLFLEADWDSGEAELREPNKCDGWQWYPFFRLPEPLFEPIPMTCAAFLGERKS